MLTPTETIRVLFIFGVFSVMYKDTLIYRITLAIWMGSGLGFLTLQGGSNFWIKYAVGIADGNYMLIGPVILAALLFFRFFRKYAVLARYPVGISLTANLGASIAGIIITQVYRQLTAPVDTIHLGFIAIMVVTILIYFTMTIRYSGPVGSVVGVIAKVGRILLMITFGIMFANFTVMRSSMLISQIQYIVWQWLGL